MVLTRLVENSNRESVDTCSSMHSLVVENPSVYSFFTHRGLAIFMAFDKQLSTAEHRRPRLGEISGKNATSPAAIRVRPAKFILTRTPSDIAGNAVESTTAVVGGWPAVRVTALEFA